MLFRSGPPDGLGQAVPPGRGGGGPSGRRPPFLSRACPAGRFAVPGTRENLLLFWAGHPAFVFARGIVPFRQGLVNLFLRESPSILGCRRLAPRDIRQNSETGSCLTWITACLSKKPAARACRLEAASIFGGITAGSKRRCAVRKTPGAPF